MSGDVIHEPSPAIDPGAITLSVQNTVTDDVKNGIRLYGLENGVLGPAESPDRANRWLSLFLDNRVGHGLFVIAKHRDELIGFSSLIDIEMLIRGKPARAAKAEFWVVKPAYRKVFLPGETSRLPWTLFERLRRDAAQYGYQVVLTVSRLAARDLRRSGDVRVSTPLTSHRVAEDRLSGCAVSDDVVSEVDELSIAVSELMDNALIASTPAMINTRFPASRYVKLILSGQPEGPLLFIFDRSAPGGSTNLVHWSGFPASFEAFTTVLSSAVEATKAKSVALEIPTNQIPETYDLEGLGYETSFRQLNDCYLKDTNGSACLNAIDRWNVTHAHMRFYVSIP